MDTNKQKWNVVGKTKLKRYRPWFARGRKEKTMKPSGELIKKLELKTITITNKSVIETINKIMTESKSEFFNLSSDPVRGDLISCLGGRRMYRIPHMTADNQSRYEKITGDLSGHYEILSKSDNKLVVVSV